MVCRRSCSKFRRWLSLKPNEPSGAKAPVILLHWMYGLHRLRKNSSLFVGFVLCGVLRVFLPVLPLDFCRCFVPGGRFAGIQERVGLKRPRLESESVSACAPGYMRRW